jgi:sulfonate transport system substrate-binding protein
MAIAQGFRVFAVAGALLATQLSWADTARAEEIELRIGVNNIYSVANSFAANGDDQQGNVHLVAVPFTSIPDLINAVRAGQIDVAEVGAVGPVVAQAAGSDFKVIAVTQPWPKGEALIVAGQSPFHSVEDLRGRKIAYPRATNAEWLVIEALATKGLTLKDIEPVFLPAGTNLLAALQSGVIDAAAYIDVPLASYEAQGVRRIIDHGDTGFPIALHFIAGDKVIAAKPAALAAYVRALDHHLRWAQAHPRERAEAVARQLHLDPAVVEVAERRRPAGLRPIDAEIIAGNQQIADTFFKLGEIPKPLDVKSTFTTEFNAEIGKGS